jgi:DNA mismatch endonuclease (patch repair protein)
MADVYTKRKRSAVMARIRSRGNAATELKLVSLLRLNSVTGWRRHQQVFGHPDFIFLTKRLAIFVDGCFWHGCRKHGSQPLSNVSFWRQKFERNKQRDKLVSRTLRSEGWRVIRIWQHDLSQNPNAVIRSIRRHLN